MPFLSAKPQKQMSKGKQREGESLREGGGRGGEKEGCSSTEDMGYSPFSSLTPPLSIFSPQSGEKGSLPFRLSSCLVLSPCLLCRLLPIPGQSIQLSKFLLDPIRVHVSESQAGKLL